MNLTQNLGRRTLTNLLRGAPGRAHRPALALSGLVGCVVAASSVGGCGGRPSYWNDPVQTTSVAYGLAGGVALVDDADHRVVMLTVPGASLQSGTQSLPIGHGVLSVSVSPDATRMFVLSAGDWPRRTLADEAPSMTMIDFLPDSYVAEAHRFEMSEPRGNLAIDPIPVSAGGGHWAVAYAGSTTTAVQPAGAAAASFVENPNEIVLFDLTPQAPVPSVTRTLQSFGGTPQRLAFTPELMLPDMTQRRLLLIETEIDLTMLDLDHAFLPSPPPEITVPLTSGATTGQLKTAGLAVDGRNPNDPNDARFAVWTSTDTNLYTMQLVAPTTDLRNDFTPTINVTDVGGVPSDVSWVETEDATAPTGLSLRVAALVPTTSSAVLVDPDRSLTTAVALPAAYPSLSLVTDLVAGAQGASTGTDVALLWGGLGGTSGVALWTLKNSVMQPYASITTLGATQPVSAALDVPSPNQRLKVLPMTSGNGFYVLDLSAPTAPPLSTRIDATLSIAPDGGRLWAFQKGGTDLASVDFKTLNPIPLSTDLPIDSVFDISRQDGGRALVAVHDQGAIGVTVFDARTPVTATSRRIAPLLLEGP
jgi:hypothetical protein